jgi:2-polyprenyl-3-methyl-5-hydroxy-6-metoxy-1,4-benzoquinol methylase
MNPGPTDDHVADLYENSEIYKFWAEFMYPQSRDSRLATLHKSRVEWLSNAIDEFLPPKSKYRILEVGAGTGDTLFKLNSLNRSDLNTFAVEWNPDMKESLDKNGVEFLGRTIEEIRQDSQKFDVIVLFEVIEHLLDPNLFLESATWINNVYNPKRPIFGSSMDEESNHDDRYRAHKFVNSSSGNPLSL